MIYLYTGTPGSGKSLKATREILEYLERGRNVIANYPVAMTKKAQKKGGRFFYWDNSQITPDALMQFARLNHKRIKGREEKAQTLVVIDESQIMFNTREFRGADRLSWISFFSKHRHMFYDVILIAQNDRMLDRQIRCLAEYEIKHRNVNNFGTVGLIAKVIRIRWFIAVHYYRGVNQKISSNFFTLRRKDKLAYDSYLDFDSAESGAISVEVVASDSGESDNSEMADTPALARRQARGQGVPARLAAYLRGLWAFLNRLIRPQLCAGTEEGRGDVESITETQVVEQEG